MRRHLLTAVMVVAPIPSALLVGGVVALWAFAGDRIAEYVFGLEDEA